MSYSTSAVIDIHIHVGCLPVERQKQTMMGKLQFNEYLTLVGISHIVASPYHPSTNDYVERYHRTIRREINLLPPRMTHGMKEAWALLSNAERQLRILPDPSTKSVLSNGDAVCISIGLW